MTALKDRFHHFELITISMIAGSVNAQTEAEEETTTDE